MRGVFYPEHKAPSHSHTLLDPVVLINLYKLCFPSPNLSTASEAQPAEIYGKTTTA